MTEVIKIKGLDCANCARELEEEIEKIEGVQSVNVDFMTQKVYLECQKEAIDKVKYVCNHFESVQVVEQPNYGNGKEINCCHKDGNPNCCGKDEENNSCDKDAENHCCDKEKEAVQSQGVRAKKVKIANLCCANCARELEEELNALQGVSATVDFMNLSVTLNTQSTQAFESAIYCISHFEDVRIVDGARVKSAGIFKEHLSDILSISISAVFFILALVATYVGGNLAWKVVSYVAYAVAYFAVGWIVLLNTVRNIAKGLIFDENFLMVIASVGAVVLGIVSGDGLSEGVAVILLYRIGEFLQAVAVGSSRASIAELMNLKSDTATLIRDGQTLTVDPSDLQEGDTILIKVGEKVPVDCIVAEGSTTLDTSSLNGESMPVQVGVNDEVLSGSINLSKVISATVYRKYCNSAVAKILELVENSTAKKAKQEKFITKFAKYYTPIVCLLALIVAAIVPTAECLINGAFAWTVYSNWLYKALSFLVISCPCALVISVPLSYFSGIGRAARDGILVKGSTCLDEIATAKVVAFDKTGTLTEGVFKVKSYSCPQALDIAVAVERMSDHPIARAFVNENSTLVAENVEEISGYGLTALIDGKFACVGNAKLLEKFEIIVPETQLSSDASTVIFVALDGIYVGNIVIDDVIKDSAKTIVNTLKGLGIEYSSMLTGDNEYKAKQVAQEVGLSEYKAQLLPDRKLEEAERLKAMGGLIYVGDGINDAPVMMSANCAISMGKIGSDAAIEASDIVLMSDNLNAVAKARVIARKTRRIVMQNIWGSIAVKVAIMLLSVLLPSFPLIISILADVGVMLVAVLNAMRTSLIK